MTARPCRRGEGGFTLLELMISLGLFALIAVAGLALLDGVLGVEQRTGARLDRTAEVQRAMFLLSADLDQISAGDVEGDANGIRFARTAPMVGGVAVPVSYALAGDALTRTIGDRPQLALAGVASARWRYFDGGWQDGWPVGDDQRGAWPRAVAVDMVLADGATLRRVVTLPIRPVEAGS